MRALRLTFWFSTSCLFAVLAIPAALSALPAWVKVVTSLSEIISRSL